jgi:hypothetical protein
MTVPDRPLVSGIQASDFDVWCKCVRRLLAWSAGEMADWPELYATGHTPRDAARLAVYGSGQGD